jgi:hypothetical protein
MFFFGRTSLRLTRAIQDTGLGWTSELKFAGAGGGPCTVFQVRSTDKGRSWDRVPLVLGRPPKTQSFWKDNHPLVIMPDGALVGALESDGAIWLYGSECQGMTWQYLSLIAIEKPAVGKPCCAGLISLPNGRLQCYLLTIQGHSKRLCLSESVDCFSWSPPRPIADDVHSPWPLRLRDGRIVVVFARQLAPAGIGAIVSGDDGRSWSAAAMIREGEVGPDAGNPAAAELGDGHIFIAYAWQLQEGHQLDRTPFLGGSSLELS